MCEHRPSRTQPGQEADRPIWGKKATMVIFDEVHIPAQHKVDGVDLMRMLVQEAHNMHGVPTCMFREGRLAPVKSRKTDSYVTPDWVYEKPYQNDYPVRYTPLSGKFRDADWVEPRGYIGGGIDTTQELTTSVTCGGGILVANTTPVSTFDKPYYVKWVLNPQRATLWRRLFTKHPYWVPAQSIAPTSEPQQNQP